MRLDFLEHLRLEGITGLDKTIKTVPFVPLLEDLRIDYSSLDNSGVRNLLELFGASSNLRELRFIALLDPDIFSAFPSSLQQSLQILILEADMNDPPINLHPLRLFQNLKQFSLSSRLGSESFTLLPSSIIHLEINLENTERIEDFTLLLENSAFLPNLRYLRLHRIAEDDYGGGFDLHTIEDWQHFSQVESRFSAITFERHLQVSPANLNVIRRDYFNT